jgi:oligopeptide transport system substrate-binding protein
MDLSLPVPGKTIQRKGYVLAGSGGAIRIGLPAEPYSLLPTNALEIEATTVLRLLYSGLIDTDPQTGKVTYEVADSIETEDNKVWRITLKRDHRFHNGEPVDAGAFIRAWNFASDPRNGQRYRKNYERIRGWKEVQDSALRPSALSGLVKLDDFRFEIHLEEPFVNFEVFLHALSFRPMAEECLANLEKGNSHPIGNGPMQIDEEGWLHGSRIRLHAWRDYPGRQTLVDQIDFTIYRGMEPLYADLRAGDLDLARQVPAAEIPEARKLYGERFLEVPTGTLNYLGFPLYDSRFTDPKLRMAFSLAVDRQQIIDTVLAGAAVPACGLIPPVVPGGRRTPPPSCRFDPERARQLLAEAGGWPAGEPLMLRFNPEGDHESWVWAVGEQIREHLGIDFELNSELTWANYLKHLNAHKFTGPFRFGQTVGYNSPESQLKNYFYTGASSNYFDHQSDAFDALLDAGDRQATLEQAVPLYQQAEDILLSETMPVAPLWRALTSIAYNENVGGVEYNVYEANPVFHKLTVSS